MDLRKVAALALSSPARPIAGTLPPGEFSTVKLVLIQADSHGRLILPDSNAVMTPTTSTIRYDTMFDVRSKTNEYIAFLIYRTWPKQKITGKEKLKSRLNKKAVLSQRSPRNAPYIWVP